jgi:hypothetical protein
MANVNKADFYYGAMLSVMITRGVQKPALFEESDNKRIYTFYTDKGDCFLQVLFAESCKLKIQNVALWKIHSFAS